ncbi:hypothetical protein B9Z19DRAFT_1109293 [Tuber borchii]|uniref:Uncharacterized protein n=1 Tax=Tuber borchii TaxID=42251 RepID=A0A2T6ZMM2_TUBBO|nr:hypothetical protein B9Z19DRAFT_1109293 [Tuber borchii]
MEETLRSGHDQNLEDCRSSDFQRMALPRRLLEQRNDQCPTEPHGNHRPDPVPPIGCRSGYGGSVNSLNPGSALLSAGSTITKKHSDNSGGSFNDLKATNTQKTYECVEWKDDLALHLRSVLPVVHGGHPQDSSWAIAGIVIFLQGQQQDPSFDMNQQPVIQNGESGRLLLFEEFQEGSCAGAGPPTMATGIGIFSQSPREPFLCINQQPIMQEKGWRSPPLSGEPQESFCGGPGSPAIAIGNDQSSQGWRRRLIAPPNGEAGVTPDLVVMHQKINPNFKPMTQVYEPVTDSARRGTGKSVTWQGALGESLSWCKLPGDGPSEMANHCGVMGGRMSVFPLLDMRWLYESAIDNVREARKFTICRSFGLSLKFYPPEGKGVVGGVF